MTTTAVTNLGISPSGTESIIRTSVTILVFFDRPSGKALGPVKKTSDYDLGTKLQKNYYFSLVIKNSQKGFFLFAQYNVSFNKVKIAEK